MKKGFTMLEVMLAAAIMTGLLVAVLSLYIGCYNMQDNANNTSKSLFQMRAKIEELKSQDFSVVRGQVGGYTHNASPDYYYQESALAGVGSSGKMRLEISVPAGFTLLNTDVLDVRVISGWVGRGGKIIGEGKLVGGFTFDETVAYSPIDTSRIDSPVELTTAIANAGAL